MFIYLTTKDIYIYTYIYIYIYKTVWRRCAINRINDKCNARHEFIEENLYTHSHIYKCTYTFLHLLNI